MNALETVKLLSDLYEKYEDSTWAKPSDELTQKRVRLQMSMCEYIEGLESVADSCGVEVWIAIGDAYCRGKGVKIDNGEAMKWYRKGVEQNDIESMVRLGGCLTSAGSTEAEWEEGINLFRQAETRGSVPAMVSLGLCYSSACWSGYDCEESLRWFKAAHAKGHKKALNRIGLVYLRELNRPKDAIIWYYKAATSSVPGASLKLARIFDDEDGEFYDPTEAVKWFESAYKESRTNVKPWSCVKLAEHYMNGIGVPKDIEAAKRFLNEVIEYDGRVPDPDKNKAHELLLKIGGQSVSKK